MEENKNYQDILNDVINGTTNEDKVAEVFAINLEDEQTEKALRDLMDSLYEEWFKAEDEEKGKGEQLIVQYVDKFKALNKPKADPQPKLQTSEKGTYVGFFLAPLNHRQRIEDELRKMAETDEELAKAIAEGKKTFEGCDRFIKNNMKDIARELKQDGAVVYDDDAVHQIARWYMVNPDAVDVQNAVKAVKQTTKEKPKKESKPKEQAKPKKDKGAKVVPLTPQMGSLFGDDDF